MSRKACESLRAQWRRQRKDPGAGQDRGEQPQRRQAPGFRRAAGAVGLIDGFHEVS